MVKKKFIYSRPKISSIILDDEIMEVIGYSPTPADPEAKEASEFVEEEEALPVDKNIWEEENEE